MDLFRGLSCRIYWHRTVLLLVGAIEAMGEVIATAAFFNFTRVDVGACLIGGAPIAFPETRAGFRHLPSPRAAK
jgi:hypothetical protein